MKKIALGDITRKVGLSKVIRELEASQDIVVLRRGNQDCALLVPVFPGLIDYVEHYSAMIATLRHLENRGNSNEEMEQMLFVQMMMGEVARNVLIYTNVIPEELQRKSDTLMVEMYGKYAQAYEMAHNQKNSPAESGSVTPMATPRAGNVEVITAESEQVHLAPSRKRGRPKKVQKVDE